MREDRAKANARIQAALNQVDLAVNFKLQGERKHATLYVGNLEFNASEQDVRKALDRLFTKIRVEKVTIPRVNGLSKCGHRDNMGTSCADTDPQPVHHTLWDDTS